ncbi:MAG: hypothetical protein AAGD14_02060 [Planctomycetota bacterium]
MRWILGSVLLLGCFAHAQEPTVILDFETGEPADGWRLRNLAMSEVTFPEGKTPSGGRALALHSRGERKGGFRGMIQRSLPRADWRTAEAFSFHAKVEADGPIALRVIAIRGRGPAGLLRRFTLEPGDWREVTLPLKDFRESGYDQVCGFEQIDRLMIRWDRGAGSVTIDDLRLLPGKRGVLSCTPTNEDRAAVAFGPDAKQVQSFESEHFVVLTNVPTATKEAVAPLLARLEEGLVVLRDRYGVAGSFDDKVPLLIYRTLDGYRAAVPRIGKHYGAGVSAPQASGYSFFGVGMSVFVPAKGWERPVFLHEAIHGAVHRLLGVASNGNWIQEGLAPAVQVTVFPDALDRKKFGSAFHMEKGGWLLPWDKVLAGRSVRTRNYPQTLSFMEFLADRHGAKLPEIWSAVRAVRGPIHKEAMPAIAKALGTTPEELQSEWLAWGPEYFGG